MSKYDVIVFGIQVLQDIVFYENHHNFLRCIVIITRNLTLAQSTTLLLTHKPFTSLSGKAMNKFLNENWENLSVELQQPMEEALRDFLKPLADHALATLNADDIL